AAAGEPSALRAMTVTVALPLTAMEFGLALMMIVGLSPEERPTWTSTDALDEPPPPEVPPPPLPPVDAVTRADPDRLSAWNVTEAVPPLWILAIGSMLPLSTEKMISVPGFSGLPFGWRPMTVIVEVPFRLTVDGLALMLSVVPLGATGEALSQPRAGSRRRAASSRGRNGSFIAGVYERGRLSVQTAAPGVVRGVSGRRCPTGSAGMRC